MKKIFLILITNFCLGANLMQYDLFNHDDSVDIALAFDSAYKPDIVRRVDGQSMSLILKGLGGDEKFNEMRTNQKVLKSFTIAPKGKDIEINFPTGADLSVDALTQDGNLKLILRVKNPAFDQSKMSVKSEANETTQSGSSGVSVMPIIVALLLAAAAFVGVRKFLSHKPQKSIDETWRVFEDDASMEDADVDEASIDEILNDSSFKNQSGSKNANFTNYSDAQEFAKKDEVSALNSKNSNDSKNVDSADFLRGESADDKFYDEVARAERLETMEADENSESAENIRAADKISPLKVSPVESGTMEFREGVKERSDTKEPKISAFKSILENELLSSDTARPSDVRVELVREIDENNAALVLSFAGKKHLVVLKSSNAID
ncbi:hypothetical protein [Campylobacter gracilis]|uniref:Uncharacterized protein n=1 Tax=Campylobacter gracilis RM3268 TaxID=553220 RepID=C8PEK0_9BACT|nr:hypothetical protein [Campylobacter gracilis]AKT91942.1 hypothetical protein CGRAC_0481 [Campylobacter gracilis]EEV18795.1 hypothetical protein CAMGR0001_1901 [Campylobacter gracilis RM3268]UEB45849.1 hypothetical protein LK410_01785 [Campylobacter gracilis]SUW77604.1 excinuclease ABC subunit A [Campylobacter gracilis]